MDPATQRANLRTNIDRFGLDLDPEQVMALPAPERQRVFSEALDRSLRESTPQPDGGHVRNRPRRPKGLGIAPDSDRPSQMRRTSINRLPEPIPREEAIAGRERRKADKRRRGVTRSADQVEADRRLRIEAARTRIRDRLARRIAIRNGRKEPSESDRREAESRMPSQYTPPEAQATAFAPTEQPQAPVQQPRPTFFIPGRSALSGGVLSRPPLGAPIPADRNFALPPDPQGNRNQYTSAIQSGPFGSMSGVDVQNPAQIRQFKIGGPE